MGNKPVRVLIIEGDPRTRAALREALAAEGCRVIEAGAGPCSGAAGSPAKVRAWVRALLRRLSLDKRAGGAMAAGGLRLDLASHIVSFRGQSIPGLTSREFDLLAFLVRTRPRVASRRLILSRAWRTVAVAHLVDAHIWNMRKKLPPALSRRIQNVPGRGFRYL